MSKRMAENYLTNPDLPIDFEEMGKGLRKQQKTGVDVEAKIKGLRDILSQPKKESKRKI